MMKSDIKEVVWTPEVLYTLEFTFVKQFTGVIHDFESGKLTKINTRYLAGEKIILEKSRNYNWLLLRDSHKEYRHANNEFPQSFVEEYLRQE